MVETCPHLTYHGAGDRATFDGATFDEPRAFCTVTGSFVQPMRADICNARYGLDPATDCGFYVEPESGSEPELDSESEEETPSDSESGASGRPDAER
ncbi:hypothetical protein [Halorubrum lipolyticum]|uniref:Uncharacterized protein n=1 Tax=Halorubrum lipolyticum DSM 21995 TaxID=1227482 RepID=M0NK93_9EURY|nr:hypothetical protein [Halorubrum lipolyticum]EMA57090.1 hypothetical protein C469_15198 [Halorubrum lipolyticum DSM 21995]